MKQRLICRTASTEVTMDEYNAIKKEFYTKHSKNGSPKENSSMDNDVIHKCVSFEDGAQWCEVTEMKQEIVDAEAHGVKVKALAQFNRTEFWSSDNSISRYLYEPIMFPKFY